MSIWAQKSASIQPRTSLLKLAELPPAAERSAALIARDTAAVAGQPAAEEVALAFLAFSLRTKNSGP